jgi:hypothetical protein
MSDTELRLLQRFLAQNPDDYAAWGHYLQVGARVGAYDPNVWNDAVTWITGIIRPTPAGTDYPHYDYEQAQAWSAAEEHATSLLHQIRNTHQQLPAAGLALVIDQFLSKIYSKKRKVTIARAEEYCQFPVVVIDDTYRVLYDEQHRHIENKAKFARLKWVIEPRSVLDITPQYLIETDIHYGGSRWEPPDSEPVTLDTANNLHELLTKLVNIIENNENQEIYYDERQEEIWSTDAEVWPDTNSDAYLKGTFERIKSCLDNLFQKYRVDYDSALDFDAAVTGRRNIDILASSMFLRIIQRKPPGRGEVPFEVSIDWAAGPTTEQTHTPTVSLLHPWQVVEYAWKSWVAEKLKQELRLL